MIKNPLMLVISAALGANASKIAPLGDYSRPVWPPPMRPENQRKRRKDRRRAHAAGFRNQFQR